MAEKKADSAKSGTMDTKARKAAPRKGARSAADVGPARSETAEGKSAKPSTGRTRKSGPDLKKDLRAFADARPDGWGHDDWLRFLEDLGQRGHNINDRDAIGSMLERERLVLALEKVPGVGPRRVQTIADRYGYLWRLRETDADQLAREANVPRAVAERVIGTIGG